MKLYIEVRFRDKDNDGIVGLAGNLDVGRGFDPADVEEGVCEAIESQSNDGLICFSTICDDGTNVQNYIRKDEIKYLRIYYKPDEIKDN